MIAAALMAALAGIIFVEQDIPEVRVNARWMLQSFADLNLRHGDVDGDGATDLIFKSHVILQREGVFSQASRVELPTGLEDVACDTWQGGLYLRHRGRLTVLRWNGGRWEEALNHPIDWPGLQGADEGEDEEDEDDEDWDSEDKEEEPGVRFERFLHDLDGDGVPEFILPAPEGLLIYAREGDVYAEKSLLDVVPPPEVWGYGRLWPKEKRGIKPLERYRHWWLHVEGNRLTVINRKDAGEDRVRFEEARYTLDRDFAVIPEKTRTHSTEPMDHWPQPMRLNGDDMIDYVDWEFLDGMRTTPMPTPVFETRVSTDGGKTCQVFRAAWVLSQGMFTDFDGDGGMDMVFNATGVFRGGVRESVARLVTQRTVEHEVRIHLQDGHGVFSQSPGVRIPLTIRLDKPLIRGSDMAERYGGGLLVDLGGDFNGDGRADLAVHERPDRLAVYLNTGAGFSREPNATIVTQPDWPFSVADIDRDGRSDIVLRVESKGESGEGEKSRVFLVREAEP